MDANVMSVGGCYYSSNPASYEAEEEMGDIRKGPWTAEEDLLLTNYIHIYGEGRWNSLARSAGLNRTGKSCRLRWLNYLRPDVRRGNISPQEQLLILQLHTRWGNRWSKIAQYLPGRTDNEIKNYWRTRVQKQAKQLKCDVNSKQFRDTMRYVWIPRLAERIRAESGSSTGTATQPMGSTNNDFIGHPNYHYKSDGSSESSSEVTQVRRPDLCMTDGYNIGARVQYEPKSACGPEEFGGSSPSGGYGKEEMDLDYPCLNLEQSDISDIGWLAGEDSSTKDTDNMTWNNEEIYDDLDAWLGDE